MDDISPLRPGSAKSLRGHITTPGAALVCAGLLAAIACGGSSAKPPPPSPSGDFIGFGSSSSTMSLAWKEAAGATGYTLERKTGGGTYALVATLEAPERGFLDKGLARSTTYAYRLTAAGASPGFARELSTTTGDQDPVATGVGTPVGQPVAKVIGAAGGSLTSEDGEV